MMLWPAGSRATKLLLQNKSLSYLLLTCILCLLISFGGLWLINYDSQQQQQQFIRYHGQIVNKLTVNQLATTMANKDLIGMQSLLQRLAQQKSIANAIIYDVDNTVIVQSGIISSQPLVSHQSFTTPIAMDNSLLGSLTTTINIEFKPNSWLLLVIVVGSLLPFILLSRYVFKIRLTPKSIAPNLSNGIEKNTEVSTKNKDIHTYGLLLIQIHDLDKISKQLNAQARNNEFKTLDKLLKNSLTLYSGEKIALNQGCIVLKFRDEDKDKYIFNATCCAYLLLEAAKKMRLFLKLSATLYSSSNIISLQQEIPQLINLSHADKILINNSDLDYHLMEERLIFEEIEDSHFIKVVGFSERYQKLLENQLRYLLSVN
jgi:uncharacterized membrane protein affecting hemolysin expression